jgi:hypothetical protein
MTQSPKLQGLKNGTNRAHSDAERDGRIKAGSGFSGKSDTMVGMLEIIQPWPGDTGQWRRP